MNFLKKLFNIQSQEDKEIKSQEVNLSLDDLFVHNFLNKGGKFLYCTKQAEIKENVSRILLENNWQSLHLLDASLQQFISKTKITTDAQQMTSPIFSTCEHLIAENGDLMFSSNQLGSKKLMEYPENFIVFATTSQIVKDTGQGLTGIKTNCKNALPTNISSIRNYTLKNNDDSFLNYGNSNSKNLYLLLLENL